MAALQSILKEKNLKTTKLRIAVLELLEQSQQGYTHQELSQMLDISFDRASLFRTLSQLEEADIVHKIYDLEGVANYAINPIVGGKSKENCSVHFICTICGKISCLEEYPSNFEQYYKQNNFEIEEVDVTIKGNCTDCKIKA